MDLGKHIVNVFLGSGPEPAESEAAMTEPTQPVAIPATTAPSPTATITVATNTETEALRAELARERAERTRERAQFIEAAANAFYATLLHANRVLPAEKDALLVLYYQLADDDLARPAQVALAGGVTGNRLEALRAAYQARPAHTLREEHLAGMPESTAILTNRATTDPNAAAPTNDRLKELLGHTTDGRQALATPEPPAANGHR